MYICNACIVSILADLYVKLMLSIAQRNNFNWKVQVNVEYDVLITSSLATQAGFAKLKN